ncbi:MAG: hypothetical protein ACT4OP_05430 [Actinomycetota bacterium]
MDASIPIACSLETDAARRRWRDWKALAGQLRAVERSDQHLTIRYGADHPLRAKLERLVEAERQCCGFVAWDLDDRGDEMVLTIRGDNFGVMAMAEAFGS